MASLFALLILLLPQQSSGFQETISTIASGADSSARRLAITKQLDAAGVSYRLDDFSLPNFSGTNIVADVPARKPGKVLLLGAHYDRVAQGQGAVDNAGSCAVLLRLLASFKAKPLENYSIRAVFFDLEEGGLVGSQAYFAKNQNSEKPALALNLDIFGYGDTFFAVASSETGVLANALQQAAKQSSFSLRLTPRNQYPASDHRIMMAVGIETVGLALIDGSEIDSILQRGGPAPRILTIIHTPADTIDKIRATDMEKAFPVLEQTIRMIDGQ
jgi:aminopeptidase S